MSTKVSKSEYRTEYLTARIKVNDGVVCKDCSGPVQLGFNHCRYCWEMEDKSCYLCGSDLACNECGSTERYHGDDAEAWKIDDAHRNSGWHCVDETGCGGRFDPANRVDPNL